MSSQSPPPLPDRGLAFRTYVSALVPLVPVAFVWSFGKQFLFPKIQLYWQDAGLGSKKINWLMESCSVAVQFAELLFLVAAIGIILAEIYWRVWPRIRWIGLLFVTAFFHTYVLVVFAVIAILSCLAAPLLGMQK